MIYVDQKQLDQVEYLIEQSTKGHHVLFDVDVLRKVFSDSLKNKNLETKKNKTNDTVSAEGHIENLILQPTLLAKKAYLEKLNAKTFNDVVVTYFSIVENNIFESSKYNQ